MSYGMGKEHHLPDGRFGIPWPGWRDTTLPMVLKWAWSREKRPNTGWLLHSRDPTPEELAAAFPVHKPNVKALQNPPGSEIQAMWIGHATVMVLMDGVTFMTDPVFSERVSPSQRFGSKRTAQLPMQLTDPSIPKLDFVVISHNHYDHLDYNSVKQIDKRWGDELVWYVPLRLKAWFTSVGITNVIEMDWWDEVRHKDSDIVVTMTPAQHWSNRSLTWKGFDKNKTLWGGYAVKGRKRSFWFAGDTGYAPVFTEIGKRLGPFDLAAIPIGAYEPRALMHPQHCNAEEAVRIHKDVRSKQSIGIHCATFCLTDEAMDEPPKELVRLMAAEGPLADSFVTLQHGSIIRTNEKLLPDSPALLGHETASGKAFA